MTTHEKAFTDVQKLVADFRSNEHYYLSTDYQEQEARRDFIDKFFIALGWDVNHDTQKNPFEQEVKVERGVNVYGVQKRADYAFYIGNYRDVRFFVEAKKPYGDIATATNYFQTIRYGWNAQTPLAILTDFEQFHVLDCRYKPDIDFALNCAVKTYHYSDYEKREEFAEIFYLFSREAIAAGSLEKFAKEMPKRRGKAVQRGLFPGAYKGIDDAFLEELDDYRHTLAHMFKDADASLDGETLTEITQRTIDRLVFTRFLEDRQIESEPIVARFGERGSAWGDFLAACRRLDGIYNGIVFKKHDILDSTSLKVDDAKFADIRENLSHLNTPYDFNIIPIHILGSIYERFLGKVISAGPERVRVDEKPEVRKAGGVYYTPQYIVKYIVENTVGKMIEGKSPNQIAEMRFADISCGSGSFLLEVFDTLLQYHRRYYNANPTKARKGDCENRDGVLHLSLKKRREILLNNIYGVDIDSQAVEVAQLSLYLKLLEEETIGTTHGYQQEFHETLLPSLNKNVVCGNSLIGTDIQSGELFPGEEERKLNAMDFEARFPEVMRAGGFDAIVGNPPYVRPHNITPQMKKLLWARYKTFVAKSDLYSCFMERGIKLVRNQGFLAFIVPQTWTSLESFTAIRSFILANMQVCKLVQLPHKVFSEATVETCIFVFRRLLSAQNNGANKVLVEALDETYKKRFIREFFQKDIRESHLNNFQLYGKQESNRILNKIRAKGKPLGKMVKFLYGFKTADDEKFIQNTKKHKESKPFVRSAAIHRYLFDTPQEYVWYVPELMTKNATTARPGESTRFESEKILVARMGKSLVAAYDKGGLYVKDAMLLLSYIEGLNLKYLLGVINSRMLNYFYKEYFVTIDVLKNALLSLPIYPIDLGNGDEKKTHDDIVQKVEMMLEARKLFRDAKTDKDKIYYEQKCVALDRQIDDLIYKLYGLDEKDIQIIEGNI